MIYDPIHDTYNPVAGSTSGPANPTDLNLPQNDLYTPAETAALATASQIHSSALPQLRNDPLAPAMMLGRPQFNLHRLLDGSSRRLYSDGNSENTPSGYLAPGAGTSGVAALPTGSHDDSRVLHDTSDKYNANSPALSFLLSAKNNSSVAKEQYLHATPQASVEESSNASDGPLSTAQLSLEPISASDSKPKDCDDLTDSHVIPETATGSGTSDVESQRQMDYLDQSSCFDNGDSSSSQRSVPLGSLPPDFRAVTKGLKYLKKTDGEPFWRRDIQHDFLEELFGDQLKVFTNYFPPSDIENAANGPKLTFAELYVRTLAESSKSSRILSERLIRDSEVGILVSKVCLLVNAGRMNTTINFVPDMRSVLRTYHLIPSLQADPDGISKPLQDTPRLKTILKAVCDGLEDYQTLFDVLRAPKQEKPNTNIIKLIFLMSSFFQNIPYHYDDLPSETFTDSANGVPNSHGPQNKFMEFFLNDKMSPKSRARRFLWLMYTYMETSFHESELEKNPFNPKHIPPIEYISPEELGSFDRDTDYEIEYATKMYHTRMMHLNEDIVHPEPKRGSKGKREKQDSKKASGEQSPGTGQRISGKGSVHESVVDDSMTLDETCVEDCAEPLEKVVISNESSTTSNLLRVSKSLDASNDLRQSETLKLGNSFKSDQSSKPSQSSKPNESSKVNLNSDRPQRKRPTPSFSSLIDDHKKTSDLQRKWKNPKFSPNNIPEYRTKFSLCTKQLDIPQLKKESHLSNTYKKMNSQRAKGIVAHILRSVPNYEARRKEITQWMYRYFQYKKSSGNGLLGMEWEDIRSDLINGVEAYLYQKLGKDFITQYYDEKISESRQENSDLELVRKENFMTSSDQLPGDSAPIDVGDINETGHGYVPSHDFDCANERTTYEFLLLQIAEDVIIQSLRENFSQTEAIHFDLDTETLLFRKK